MIINTIIDKDFICKSLVDSLIILQHISLKLMVDCFKINLNGFIESLLVKVKFPLIGYQLVK